jgi:hypothetical protein
VSTTKQWDELFAGRHWRVGEEYTGRMARGPDRRWHVLAGSELSAGPVITYDRGRFSMRGVAYQSPLSTNRGLRGVILVETDAEGRHDLTGPDGRKVRIAVGEPAVKRAREQFGAIW